MFIATKSLLLPRFPINNRLTITLNRGDTPGHLVDLSTIGMDGDVESHGMAAARCQFGDSARLSFGAATVGIVNSRLQAGDVAVRLRRRVFPKG